MNYRRIATLQNKRGTTKRYRLGGSLLRILKLSKIHEKYLYGEALHKLRTAIFHRPNVKLAYLQPKTKKDLELGSDIHSKENRISLTCLHRHPSIFQFRRKMYGKRKEEEKREVKPKKEPTAHYLV